MIPIVADAELVDPQFGTGAVKITPAHDFNDFAVGKRHSLAMINIMNKDGTINDFGGQFTGMDRFVAREEVKKELPDESEAFVDIDKEVKKILKLADAHPKD